MLTKPKLFYNETFINDYDPLNTFNENYTLLLTKTRTKDSYVFSGVKLIFRLASIIEKNDIQTLVNIGNNFTIIADILESENSMKKAPPSVYYIPNFITNTEETDIKNHVYSVPKPKWTCLSNRRLQDYGGVPHKNGMLVETIPNWLNVYMKKVNELNVFNGKTANHVLINEYEAGQGIMPHTDGPLFYPTVTTINCLSHTVLEFKKMSPNLGSGEDACKLLLEPRSLLILQDDMYENYLHSIAERNCDILTDSIVNLNNYKIGQKLERSTRLSVTIRNVPKVAKLKLRF